MDPGGAAGVTEALADYTLVRSLGGGTHGEFFVAIPPSRLGVDAEFVAVKVLAGPTSEDAFRRATRELNIFASVDSSYLVKLYDAGQDRGRFFYTMEYLPLGSLAVPAVELNRAIVLPAMRDAARAVDALHEAGVVHRSVKPANVLLHEEGGARLSDLGLAQTITPGLSMTGLGPVGAVEYLDPAVLRGQAASRASDIWSLGATLHRALTGRGVYGEIAEGDSLLAVRTVLAESPMLDPGLSPDEAALIAQCLRTDPAERPATAAAVAEALAALVSRS